MGLMTTAHITDRDRSYGVRKIIAAANRLTDGHDLSLGPKEWHIKPDLSQLTNRTDLSLHDGDFDTNTRTEYPAGTTFILASTSNAGFNGIECQVICPDGVRRSAGSLGKFDVLS